MKRTPLFLAAILATAGLIGLSATIPHAAAKDPKDGYATPSVTRTVPTFPPTPTPTNTPPTVKTPKAGF